MALKYPPRPGTLWMCDFDTGFKPPEMVKKRPVVVISPRPNPCQEGNGADGGATATRHVKLPRFCGYITLWGEGVHDAKDTTTISGGIPATDGGTGPRWADARVTRAGVRAVGPDDSELGTASDEGRRADGVTTAERAELRRLRRENARLREERTILEKAAAWFARETGSIPSRSSNS